MYILTSHVTCREPFAIARTNSHPPSIFFKTPTDAKPMEHPYYDSRQKMETQAFSARSRRNMSAGLMGLRAYISGATTFIMHPSSFLPQGSAFSVS